jgi:hypothetical protein
MKKVILCLTIFVMLFAYAPVQAQVTQDDLNVQLEVLKQQLIDMLLKQLSALQAQLAEMLAVQAELQSKVVTLEDSNVQAQEAENQKNQLAEERAEKIRLQREEIQKKQNACLSAGGGWNGLNCVFKPNMSCKDEIGRKYAEPFFNGTFWTCPLRCRGIYCMPQSQG